MLTHTIRTWNPWHDSELATYDSRMDIKFNVDDDPKADRALLVFGETKAPMDYEMRVWFIDLESGRLRGHPVMTRPDLNTMTVTFPARLLGKDVDRYYYKVHTAFASPEPTCTVPGAPSSPGQYWVCHDWAPNRPKWLTHEL
jgi:hypothetical protein